MGGRSNYKHLSGRARGAMGGEIEDAVTLLSELDEVDAPLIAALANDGGGVVLVGVAVGEDGGCEILGCAVDDEALASVAGAAAECIPPVPVEMVAENTAREPFLRIEVPGGLTPGELSRVLVPAEVADELILGLEALTAEVEALRQEVAELRAPLRETRSAARDTLTRLEELQRTARDGISRTRALARHLGADDKLVAWERRQLRALLAAAVGVAGKRARANDSDEVLTQVRKTWSRFTDWVSDEVVDPLQKDAGDLFRGGDGGDDTGGDDPEGDDTRGDDDEA